MYISRGSSRCSEQRLSITGGNEHSQVGPGSWNKCANSAVKTARGWQQRTAAGAHEVGSCGRDAVRLVGEFRKVAREERGQNRRGTGVECLRRRQSSNSVNCGYPGGV